MTPNSRVLANAPTSLLIVPASLVGNWKAEVAKFAPDLRLFIAHPTQTTREQLDLAARHHSVGGVEQADPAARARSGVEPAPAALEPVEHERKLELFNLKKETDWTDPASVRGYREKVAALKEEWQVEDEEAGVNAEAEAEAESKPVRKAGQARGAQSPADGNLFESQIKAGEATASQINKMRGYADVGNSKEN